MGVEVIEKLEKVLGQKYSEEQVDILETPGGLCVIACAGSGKTTTVIGLVAKRIIEGSIRPDRMICATFSSSGAEEMRKRLAALLTQAGYSNLAKMVKIKTIHAVCREILVENGWNVELVSVADRSRYVRKAVTSEIQFPENDLLESVDSMLSYQINGMLSDEKLMLESQYDLDFDVKQWNSIRRIYTQCKRDEGKIDFDDMLLFTYGILYGNNSEMIRNMYRNRYDSVFLDEMQDTNNLQMAIMETFIRDGNGLVVVGDDDQCIYKFQSANPDIILGVGIKYNIPRMFISTNYRCGKKILKYAVNCVQNNEKRISKDFRSPEGKEEGEVWWIQSKLSTHYSYAMSLCKVIEKRIGEGIDPMDICVLGRYNQDMGLVSAMLYYYGIESECESRCRLYKGKVFSDIKGILDLIDGEEYWLEGTNFQRNIWKLVERINKNAIKVVGDLIKSTPGGFKEALKSVVGYNGASTLYEDDSDPYDSSNRYGSYRDSMVRDSAVYMSSITIESFRILLDCLENKDKVAAVEGLLYQYYTRNEFRFQNGVTLQHMKGLVDFTKALVKKDGLDKTIKFFTRLENFETSYKGEFPSVKLMAAHGSKGMEWDEVYIMGLDNDSYGSKRAMERLEMRSKGSGLGSNEIAEWYEEERRLFYVSCTRARKVLGLVSGGSRENQFFLEGCGSRFEGINSGETGQELERIESLVEFRDETVYKVGSLNEVI